MKTEIEKLEEKIIELESWLKFNHAEHLSVVQIQTDLRIAKADLEIIKNERPFERDTFDIREHNFNTTGDERK